MEILDLPFFPFPRTVYNHRIPGYIFIWPKQCDSCDRRCQNDTSNKLSICPWGINYQRISKSQMIFGFLLPSGSTTNAQRKALRQHPQNRITPRELEKVLATLKTCKKELDEELDRAKDQILEDYRQEKRLQKELLDLLRPEIERNLAFLHDYKQFVARVKQNINVVLKTHYGQEETEQLLSKALPSEVAIYWASSLMTEKLQTAFLLLHPEKLHPQDHTVFRLHGMVLKYIRIYNSSFRDKGVRLDVVGQSTGEIKGDSSAIGVIPQTLLDNALKYSPRGSTASVSFREETDHILLAVMSFGPKIDPDEIEKIFDIFYRGRNAVTAQEEGAGFGLHLAQYVAKSLGTEIKVKQSPHQTRLGYETTFSILFRRER